MIVNKNYYPTSLGFSAVSQMRDRFDTLQVQLATGKNASQLSELGNNRSYDLNLRAVKSRIDGYSNSIQMVNLRLDFLDNAMSQLDQLEADTRSSAAPGGYGSDNINLTSGPALAESRMQELVSVLNLDVDGRYLFGGSKTDAPPVASVSAILDGEGGRDGFRTIAAERLQADQGADGRGRLTVSRVTDTVTLDEDGSHPFGFKLSTLSSDSADVSLTAPSGDPASLSVQFTGTASAGDKIRVGLTLPDGKEQVIELTAVDGAPSSPFEFRVGASAELTADNFEVALGSALDHVGSRELASASNFAAAENFFNGVGETVQRVDGPPYDSATGFVAATAADTVFWYTGEDSSDPRRTVSARVDEAVRANYGVQANESGIAEMMRNLAVMASSTFSASDETSGDRFDYIATQQQARLAESNNGEPGSIEMITLDLGLARASTSAAQERHTAHGSQVDELLAGIEEAPIEQVAAELLSLQTRLQASYETISQISQLTLVNFLR
ncbi:MAG: hypothetical protein KDJ19_01915 [Hyphomicrobiaceae bacterium]|nr:hypothetical protein [Hyphomicrobiaceae bacterium]MCC0024780.1 hypothetical protein [Hyphomicrobiaceae bacterium]